MQLVQSPHDSSLYSTRVLLARTIFTADDISCAISARASSLYSTPWSLHALPVPPMLQLVQTPLASSLYSTRVLLVRATCTTDDATFAVFERLGSVLDPGSPCRHELSHRGYSLCTLQTPPAFTRPGFPGRHELFRRCYSLCSLRTPRTLTRPEFPSKHELSCRCYSLCSLRTPGAFTRPGFPGRHKLSRRCYSFCSPRTPRALTQLRFPDRHKLYH